MMLRLSLLTILFASQASAGNGWIGSGGEVFKDAHNPWFVKNTSTVRYCIDVSPTSISISKTDVKKAVGEALEHWNRELSRASTQNEDGHFALGGIKFVEEECPADMTHPESDPSASSAAHWPDLRFLFGYEALSSKEVEFLQDPKKFIGVSVRTSYDEVSLKGKGFIYIASDFGPHVYDNAGTLVEKAWSRPKLLKYALLHEIGHVFGLPHTGSGLMSEAFLEQMLNKNLAEKFEKIAIPTFFEPAEEVEMCDWVSNTARVFFKMRADHRCLLFTQKAQFKWEISAKTDVASAAIKLGDVISQPPDFLDYQPKAAIFLHLTSKQKVFTAKETAFRSFMFGPMLKEHGSKANFIAGPGEVKSGYLRITPSSLLFTGIANGKVELVMSYSSPLGVLLTMSPKP